MNPQDPRRLASELAIQKFDLLVQVAALRDQVAALTEERDGLQLRNDNCPIAHVVIDRESQIHHANPAAAMMFRTTLEALSKGRLDAWLDASSLPYFRTFLGDVSTAGRSRCSDVLVLDHGIGTHVLAEAVELPDHKILCSLVDVSGMAR